MNVLVFTKIQKENAWYSIQRYTNFRWKVIGAIVVEFGWSLFGIG